MTAIFMAGSFLLGRLSRSCRGTRRSSGRSRGGSPREVLTGPGGLRPAHLLLVITAAGAGLAAVAATVRPVLRAGACLRALGVTPGARYHHRRGPPRSRPPAVPSRPAPRPPPPPPPCTPYPA